MSHRLPFAANCSALFTEHPLLDRPAAAREAGFRAIELWWPFPTASPGPDEVGELVASVRHAGIRLVSMGFAAGDLAAGDRGLLSWIGRADEFRRSVDLAVGVGERLGVSRFNAMYGNRLAGVDPRTQDDAARSSLAYAAGRAAEIGATVLIEPLSGAPRYPLRTAAEALGVIATARESGSSNVGLLADLYHLGTNGEDIGRMIDEHCASIAHVQIADVPGRHEPGTGALPIGRHLDALWAGGYRGWVGLEYSPSDSTEASLTWIDVAARGRERPGA